MWNAGMDATQAGIMISPTQAGEISITSDMQMTPPYGKREEELKNLLMKVKEESEKVELELNIQ